ncbi:MAG TPA: sigma-70 family RNA polymerase sigma factor [Thermoanaerobaculia bacterium]|nr:sigma-70 family RNA polymerase sigma factor [Thermoanaerobaculia bacterium]
MTATDGDADARREERLLVERMLAGDARAMETFADEYFPGLYRFALGRLRGDRELAREIVQTTVCKALGKLASFRGEAPLAAWLCACCRNEVRMHFRGLGRQPPLLALDDGDDERPALPLPAPGELPEGSLLRREEAGRVHRALDSLPPRYARALEWKYLERASVEEIAARLQLGGKAAESLLSRARRAFREGYERLSRRAAGPALQVMRGETP